jgi:y4mF family transcriptional regulator
MKRLLQPQSTIAEFVRENRKKLGYNQKQLSVRVGVGLNFIRDLEQGKATLRMDKVNEVLAFFGYELTPQLKVESSGSPSYGSEVE